MINEVFRQLVQAQRRRHAINQGDVIDTKTFFQWSQPVELLEERVRADSSFTLNHQTEAVIAV